MDLSARSAVVPPPSMTTASGESGGLSPSPPLVSALQENCIDQEQNSNRRANGGSHSRSYNFHGGRPGQGHGRGTQRWNQNTRFNNNRVTNVSTQRGGYGGVAYRQPFLPSPMHMPPSNYNVRYPDPSRIPNPSYFSVTDKLHEKIMKQIDYYFSSDNLAKDPYLRGHMDEQGWVSVDFIASFNKVSSLTKSVQLILNAMQKSNVVELQGGKMRRRNDWMRWPLPAAVLDSLGSKLYSIGLQQGGGH